MRERPQGHSNINKLSGGGRATKSNRPGVDFGFYLKLVVTNTFLTSLSPNILICRERERRGIVENYED